MAAIGPGTAAALRTRGVIADVVPKRFVAEGLIEALADVPVRRALIARAAQARDVLPDALRERGAEVDVVALYETVNEQLSDAQRAARRRRRLHHLHLILDGPQLPVRAGGVDRIDERTRLVSIGPVTSATLREHGLTAHVEATRHDIDGLIEALSQMSPRRRVAARRASGLAGEWRGGLAGGPGEAGLRGRRALARRRGFADRWPRRCSPLLTDYGLDDGFAGVCHGVIAGICPAARIIDLTHGIPRQDVLAGAVVLAAAIAYLPVGVHIAVVDPGVGSERRAIAVARPRRAQVRRAGQRPAVAGDAGVRGR